MRVLLVLFFSFLLSLGLYANQCADIFQVDSLSTKTVAQIYGELKKRNILNSAIEKDLIESFEKIYLPMKNGKQPEVIGREEKKLSELEKMILAQLKLVDESKGLEPTLQKMINHPKLASKIPPIPENQQAFMLKQLATSIRAQFEILGFNSGVPLMNWTKNAKKVKRLGEELRRMVQAGIRDSKNPNSPDTVPLAMKEALSKKFDLKWAMGKEAKLEYENLSSSTRRLKLIKNAKESIFLSMWSIYDDKSGHIFKKALVDAAKRKVEVKIIVDGNISLKPGHSKVLAELEGVEGIEVLRFNKAEFKSLGYHIKTMIVDGKYLLTGGRNLGDYYSGLVANKAKWADVDVFDSGQIAAIAESYFRNTWNTYASSSIKAPARKLVDNKSNNQALSSYFEQEAGSSKLMDMMVASIYMAEFEININNAYVIFTPAIKGALKDALERNVKVRIFTNSTKSVDEPVVSVPILKTVKELSALGAEVLLKNGDTLHSKTMEIDRALSFVSSLNFHPRSAVLEAEASYISLQRDFTAQFVNIYARDYQPINSSRLEKEEEVIIPYNIPSILSLRLFYEQL